MIAVCKKIPVLMLTALVLAAPASSWSQTAPTKEPDIKPLVGKPPPFCETCGTIIAINRVPAEKLAKAPLATGNDAAKPNDKFEVVVRLDAGTQQVVTFDLAPQLKIGQKVKIVNGVVVPDLA